MGNILIIGYFGYQTNQLDGQTIKTRNVFELIRRNYSQGNVYYLDTEEIKSKPIKAFINLLIKPFYTNKIVYLPGENNLSKYFSFLYYLSKITGKSIIYPVVGGWLPQFLNNKETIANKLKEIRALLVESERMTTELKEMGFKNVRRLENFRITNFAPSLRKPNHKIKFVFMARIRRDKGCDIIFEAVNKLISQSITEFEIDFYGLINESYKSDFHCKIEKYSNTSYKGIVQPDKVFYTLSTYDCLLLPTYYEGEGFPGSIVESYISGVPVIVSEWKDLASFVKEDKTGFIIPPCNSDALVNKMLYMINNPEILPTLKENALNEAKQFSENDAWKVLEPLLTN